MEGHNQKYFSGAATHFHISSGATDPNTDPT